MTHPDLLQELELTSHLFNQKFGQSPIQRPHRRGYLRNVCIAIGNTHDSAAIDSLTTVLNREPEPLVRGAAAWALHQIGGKTANLALENTSNETDAYVLSEIVG